MEGGIKGYTKRFVVQHATWINVNKSHDVGVTYLK